MSSDILGGKDDVRQLQTEEVRGAVGRILLEADFKQVVWEMSVFSGAISTELPPAVLDESTVAKLLDVSPG